MGRKFAWDNESDIELVEPVKSVAKEGGTCKPGETAASTGCTPASGGATATATQTPTARLASLAPKVEKLGGEVENAAKTDSRVRSAMAKTGTKVKNVLRSAVLASLPAMSQKIGDVLVYEMVLNASGSAHGAPSAVLLSKAAAWGAAKAWMTARKAVTGKSAGEGDAEALYELLLQIAEAAGLEAPTLEQVKELLAAPGEPEKAKGPRNRLKGKR